MDVFSRAPTMPGARLLPAFLASLLLLLAPTTNRATPPPFATGDHALVVAPQSGLIPREANLAVNTDQPEILFTFYDDSSTPRVDPLTGLTCHRALLGALHDPLTLQPVTAPFIIVGNPYESLQRHDIKYNPFSHQYIAVATAKSYPPNNVHLVLVTLINPGPNPTNRIARSFVYQPDSLISFEDVAIAVNPRSGNFMLVAEYKVPNEGEAVVGAIFAPNGDLLTPTIQRLDFLQPEGDEDDPDVVYLPQKDRFLMVVNTDKSDGLRNRVTGLIIEPDPLSDGELRVAPPQLLGNYRLGLAEGHPTAIENPFNGEIITAFDLGGNGVPDGSLSYTELGPAPFYNLTQVRSETPYLSGTNNPSLGHNHPQLAVDPTHGVIALLFMCRTEDGSLEPSLRFLLLDTNGVILPDQPATGNILVETMGIINTDPNYYNIAYEPFSHTFISVYNTPGVVQASRLRITATYLRPTLSLQRTPDNLTLSWPQTVQPYSLFSTASPEETEWDLLPFSPTLVDDRFTLTLTNLTDKEFFRLQIPD